jgi:hypothetical protein
MPDIPSTRARKNAMHVTRTLPYAKVSFQIAPDLRCMAFPREGQGWQMTRNKQLDTTALPGTFVGPLLRPRRQ